MTNEVEAEKGWKELGLPAMQKEIMKITNEGDFDELGPHVGRGSIGIEMIGVDGERCMRFHVIKFG